jgi:Alpha amylase, C-terminal all-beta domain
MRGNYNSIFNGSFFPLYFVIIGLVIHTIRTEELFCGMFRYKVGCDLPGKYRVALDSDAFEFGGKGRVSLQCVAYNKYCVLKK